MSQEEVEQRQSQAEEHEQHERKLESEEVDDDLFGEDSDEDEEEQKENTNESGHNSIENYEENVDEDEDGEIVEREIRQVDLNLSKHPATNKSDQNEQYFVNLPAFLNVDLMPFDSQRFKKSVAETENLSEEDRIMEKISTENVIRWRYSTVGESLVKQSNAHFVEWSDGSLSLKLGSELFDVVRNPTSDHFLTVRHNELEIFQTDSIFTKNMKFIPSSTSSEIHKKLTNYIKNKNIKDDTVKAAMIDVDPEEALRKREKQEEEAIRSQRKLEQKRIQEEERQERPSRPRSSKSFYDDEYDDDDNEIGRQSGVAGGYFDDDDDGDFIAEDDEEIDHDYEEDDLDRSERLTKLKENGAKQYQQEDEEEDDEENSRSKKKRRIISDEDEE